MRISIPRNQKLIYLLLAFISAPIFVHETAVAQKAMKHVTAKPAKALLEKDTTVVVLDVRTPEEFKSVTGHLPRAINIPVQELEKRLPELEKYKSRDILVYCRSGNRSTRAGSFLLNKNFTVIHLDGGILQWNAEFPAAPQEKKKK